MSSGKSGCIGLDSGDQRYMRRLTTDEKKWIKLLFQRLNISFQGDILGLVIFTIYLGFDVMYFKWSSHLFYISLSCKVQPFRCKQRENKYLVPYRVRLLPRWKLVDICKGEILVMDQNSDLYNKRSRMYWWIVGLWQSYWIEIYIKCLTMKYF